MAPSIPTSEPTEFRQGDTVQWTKDLADYPPATHTLKYSFAQASDRQDLTATDNGDGKHLATLANDDSDDFAAGVYIVQGFVTALSGGAITTIYSGRVEVLVGLHLAANDDGVELRSRWEQMKAALEDLLYTKSGKDRSGYSIGDVSLTAMTPDELLGWYRFACQKVNEIEDAERIAQGKSPQNRKLKVRFP